MVVITIINFINVIPVLGKARVFYGIVKKENRINIRDLEAMSKGEDRR